MGMIRHDDDDDDDDDDDVDVDVVVDVDVDVDVDDVEFPPRRDVVVDDDDDLDWLNMVSLVFFRLSPLNVFWSSII